MALFDEASPPTVSSAKLPSTLKLRKVTVLPNLDNPKAFNISWPVKLGVVRYIVYVSPSPMKKNKFKEVPKTETTVQFSVPIFVPDDFIFFFWVSYINQYGKEIFIQDEPSFMANQDELSRLNRIAPNIARDIATDQDMRFYLEEIRRRHLFVNQNDAEQFKLHIRMNLGQSSVLLTKEAGKTGRVTPISNTLLSEITNDFDSDVATPAEDLEASDPAYQGPYRDPDSFGTGIAGGYLPALNVLARYGDMPQRTLAFEPQGLAYEHDVNTWMPWFPRVKVNDVMIRVRDGERFLVKRPSSSEVAGATLHQKFQMVSEPESSAVYQINDVAIREALEAQSAYDVGRWDWAIFS
jgi:hypothetical protein